MHRDHWSRAIQAAPDDAAVEGVMRVYVESIQPAVIAALPVACQRALDDPDIQHAAVALLHCEPGFKGDATTADLLREIARVYSIAAQRIARLSTQPVTPRREWGR
jgi:hypothetical protein